MPSQTSRGTPSLGRAGAASRRDDGPHRRGTASLTRSCRRRARSRSPSLPGSATRLPLAARTITPSLTPRSQFLPRCSTANFHRGTVTSSTQVRSASTERRTSRSHRPWGGSSRAQSASPVAGSPGTADARALHTSYALQSGHELLIRSAGAVTTRDVEHLHDRLTLAGDPRDVLAAPNWRLMTRLLGLPLPLGPMERRARCFPGRGPCPPGRPAARSARRCVRT
jgi:hypothetical protein